MFFGGGITHGLEKLLQGHGGGRGGGEGAAGGGCRRDHFGDAAGPWPVPEVGPARGYWHGLRRRRRWWVLVLLLLLLLGVVVVVASAGEAGCCCCCCCRGRGGLVVERMGHHGCAWSLVSSATEQRRWARQEGVRRAGHGRRLGEGTAGGGGWVRAWVARGEMCVGGALQGQRRQNRRMACAYNPLLWREAQRGGVVQEWVPVGMGWEVDEGVWVGWYVRRGRGGVWCRALGGGPGDAEGTT